MIRKERRGPVDHVYFQQPVHLEIRLAQVTLPPGELIISLAGDRDTRASLSTDSARAVNRVILDAQHASFFRNHEMDLYDSTSDRAVPSEYG